MTENKLKCKKIKDKEKESKSDFFFVLGCLPVSAFVLCHWLDMWHAHSS
jgi:hypothetical protein